MADLDFFKKLAQCNDKEEMQRCIEEYNYGKKPQTNADRFRAMSNQEQQRCVRRFWEIEDFADWLKQPAKDGEDDA